MNKERFSSRLGFILLSAGCAIGLGNVWRFPYIVGKNGGALFVLIYIAFLVVLGIPIMTAEFAVGRAAGTSPIIAFRTLKGKKTPWSLLGLSGYIGSFILMFYYTVLAGWMLYYTVTMATGGFTKPGVDIATVFGNLTGSAPTQFFWAAFCIILCGVVCAIGFNKGVETINKYVMLLLLLLILVLSVKSMTLPNAIKGLKFYLLPNPEAFHKIGWKTILFEAMNQAFFTLSLGMGCMAIFGSRIDKKQRLMGESARIAALDTFVAICAGLIIFPAASSFGIKADQGPSLVFITFPHVFQSMTLGNVWGACFFLFLSFAALSTVLAVFENIIACTIDLFHISRMKSIVISLLIILLGSVPVILGFNVLSSFHPLGKGSGMLDLFDFIVSANLLPIGSLFYLLFVVLPCGIGFKKFQEEANAGVGLPIPSFLKRIMQFVLPPLIVILLIMGYIQTFMK